VAVGAIYEFGPFRLDAGVRRLTRGSEELLVPARHFDVLVALVAQRGVTLSKDALVEAAWRDVAVTDNSLEQAVSLLRRVLGPTDAGEPHIQTCLGRAIASSRRSTP
jgi:DNA-binding winged helix-turn-helix (wHTH) protein